MEDDGRGWTCKYKKIRPVMVSGYVSKTKRMVMMEVENVLRLRRENGREQFL